MTDPNFIFLMSSDRSGSNLCLRMLGSNPNICAPPTSQIIPNLYKYRAVYSDLSIQRNWSSLLKNTEALHRASFGQWRDYADLPVLENANNQRSISLVLRKIFKAEAEAHQKGAVAVKTHRAFEYAEQLLSDFSNAKLIYLVRDPRDMCLSWLRTPALRGGIFRAAKLWSLEQAGFLSVAERYRSKIHTIKYEDLLSAPKQTLTDLCEFLQIRYHADMLSFHTKSETQDIAVHVQAWNNLAQPLMPSNHAKYKTELSDNQIAYIEATCRTEMTKLGYVPDLDPSKFDLYEIAQRLEASDPMEKPAYANLSQAEKDSHVALREAVRRFASGPEEAKH